MAAVGSVNAARAAASDPLALPTGAGGVIDKFERSNRAVKRFYQIKPQLEAFARVFTNDPKMYVVPTSGASYTNGKMIGMKVNAELGDELRHDSMVCDKRDARDMLRCPACLANENMLVPLFHEIGHVIYDSFEAIGEYQKKRAVEEAVAEAERYHVSGKRLEKVRQRMEKNPPKTYVEAAARISPFLHPILNCLEDARVNELTMQARPGMRRMFASRTRAIFEEGIEQNDGSRSFWREQPRNAQVITGLLAMASGYQYEEWFTDDVVEALQDERLRELVLLATRAKRAGDLYKLGFPILDRLRELGFCATPDDPDEEDTVENENVTPDDEDTGGDSDDSGDAGDSDDSDPGDASDDDAASDPEDGDGDTGSDDTSTGDTGDDTDPDGDASDDEDPADDTDGDTDASDDRAGMSAEEEGDERGGEDQTGAGVPEDDDEGEPGEDDGPWGDEDDDDWSDDADGEDADGDGDESDGDSDDDDGDAGEGDSGSGDSGGSPEDVDKVLKALGGHDDEDHGHDPSGAEKENDPDIERAIRQEADFDAPSHAVHSVKVVETPDDGAFGYPRNGFAPHAQQGHTQTLEIEEQVLQKSIGKMRLAFSENKKGSRDRNRRSGRVHGSALGRRIPVDDDRVFQKRTRPGRRDYHVLLGLDISYSTNSRGRIQMIKTAAKAQAELLSRTGVPFEVWAHSADITNTPGATNYGKMFGLMMHKIKGLRDPWDDRARARLDSLVPFQANLDGHTMEFYRKCLERSKATDKVLMYYTDGDMPFENFTEELEILKREIRTLTRTGVEVVGVGITNSDPEKHGLDTVRVDNIADVAKVVAELHKRLS